jgi:hypothetical protein
MKLDLVSPTVAPNIMDLRLDSREGVLMEAMNNGIGETPGFR